MINRQFNDLIDNRTDDEYLMSRVDLARLPSHVAVIMDGNGRWAKRRSLPRIAGHRAGAASVRATVETAARLGLGYLTLYAFSTENWKRPRLEVDALMKLLKEFLNKELAALQRNKIRFQMIGREQGLDARLLEEIKSAEHETRMNTGLRLNIAINYGGRSELTDAVRQMAWEVAAGRLNPDRIDEALISSKLYTDSIPDPDLLIRTSGEMRISNFLIWQIAYSELYVTERLWPDFRGTDLLAAILDYQQRDRRYGGIDKVTSKQ